MTSRFKLIAAVYVVFRQGENILMLRRANTGYEDGRYSLVAGHLDGDEPLTVAAAREAREEAGVDIDPRNLLLKTVMHRKQGEERLDFFFEAQSWLGTIRNAEPEKCDDLSWHPVNALPETTIPYIRTAIENCERGVAYSEFWDPAN